jgi:ATP-binding protein involved in chromosome partitioning
MARRSFMPVIGVIENMAGFTTPSGEHFKLFGEGGGQELADELGVPLIASIPLDPYVVEGGDGGAPAIRAHPDSPAAVAVAAAAARVAELLPPADEETCTARIDRLLQALPAKG